MNFKEILRPLYNYFKDTQEFKRLMRKFNNSRSLPDWSAILNNPEWDRYIGDAVGGKKVLIATCFGGFLPGVLMESMLAIALTLRGADVHLLLCDGAIPACGGTVSEFYKDDAQFIKCGPRKHLCNDCFKPAYKVFKSLKLKIHLFSECLQGADLNMIESISGKLTIDGIQAYNKDSIAIGEHSHAGALRYFARGTLDGEPYGESVLRKYFKSGLLTNHVINRLIDEADYDVAVFNHGIYIPHGIIGEICRKRSVHVVNWHPSYRNKTFIFSHHDTYHHTLMDEPTGKWENIPFGTELQTKIDNYLKSRWFGTEDRIWFHDKPEFDLQAIENETGANLNKPYIVLLTNVVWDAQLHYPANAFKNMIEWVKHTITHFSSRENLQLIIRVHPAEIRGSLKSRQLMVDEINKAFNKLPSNIFIVGPESQISTYALVSKANAALIYGTKTGVEIASMGIPVVVAGEAWIRNKGMTIDVNSSSEYDGILEKLPLKNCLDESIKVRAKKYAYHFFFRRMIPLEFMENANGAVLYKADIRRLDALKPGVVAGVDLICDGILLKTDFIFEPLT